MKLIRPAVLLGLFATAPAFAAVTVLDFEHVTSFASVANYYNGSTTTSSCVTGWNTAAATTTAGSPVAMPVGTVINLGSGATLTCIARNGSIIGGGTIEPVMITSPAESFSP